MPLTETDYSGRKGHSFFIPVIAPFDGWGYVEAIWSYGRKCFSSSTVRNCAEFSAKKSGSYLMRLV